METGGDGRPAAPPTTLVDNGAVDGPAPTTIVGSDSSGTPVPTTMVGPVGTAIVGGGPTADPTALAGVPVEVFRRFPAMTGAVHHGSEAVVIEADDPELGPIAVKVYRRGRTPTVGLVELLSGARFEHVVDLYDTFEVDGVWVEVLERISGGTLEDHLASNQLDEAGRRRVVEELASAVSHFHDDLGLVHRDLKPTNIMVRTTEPLDLVLADFGLAAFASDEIDLRAQDRTIQYSSPETNSGSPPRPTADWWSVGMIVAEMLLGEHPFAGLNPVETVNHLAARDIDLSGVRDDRWRRLCAGLLTRDAAHRWGGREVVSWLAGGSPTVWQPTSSRAPYVFAGEEFLENRSLVAAMSGAWEDARAVVSGAIQWHQLVDWMIGGAAGDTRLARVLDEVSATQDPDARLFQFLRTTFPDLGAVYRGYPLDGEGLAALTRDAVRHGADSDQGRAVEALFATDALRWLGDDGQRLSDLWRSEWKLVTDEATKKSQSIPEPDQAVFRARILLALIDDDERRRLFEQAATAGRDPKADRPWFRSLSHGARSSVGRAVAVLLLAEVAKAEVTDERAASAARAAEQRREALEQTLRRYPHTRSMLGWTLVPLVLMAIGTVAIRIVRVPEASWYDASASGEAATALEAIRSSSFLAETGGEIPWIPGYLEFLLDPKLPVLLSIVGLVLFVRGKGVGHEGGPLRSEPERRAMQAVIAGGCIYLPILLIPTAINLNGAQRRAPDATPARNRALRIALFIAAFGFLVHSIAMLIAGSPGLAGTVFDYPDWYQQFLEGLPPELLQTVREQDRFGPLAWLSLALAGAAFAIAMRSYRTLHTAERVIGGVLIIGGLLALVPGVLLLGFYPAMAIAIVIGAILAVVIALWLFVAMMDS